MQTKVLQQTNQVIKDLGYFEPAAELPLLLEMSSLQYGVLLLGIVFDVVIILFITISVLLIYSLLMVSVETKTFENGVMRMVGISTGDCISIIFY
jgi:hypothetical protein